MTNTVEHNRKYWDQTHKWPKDGDEWVGQAKAMRQPYAKWKRSLVDTFLAPNLNPDAVVLEIAPGHGRWSKEIVDHCTELILVDVSPSCIEHCKEIFGDRDHVRYIVNDGTSLPRVNPDHVDFVWSFDSFVHMDRETVGAYLREMSRVLKPGGKAIIHHAGRRHGFIWLRFLRHWGKPGRKLYKRLSIERPVATKPKDRGDGDGWRSDISTRIVRTLAANAGLHVEDQLRFWGENNEFGVPRFGDRISILRKP